MKVILFILLFLHSKVCYCYSDPSTWDTKKTNSIKYLVNFIANREKFVEYCYRDGDGFSIGWGDFSWCQESIDNMKFKNPLLKLIPDDILRKKVRITEAQARWRLKKFVINVYDKLEKMIDINQFDEIELTGLIDFIYTIGETKFYNKTTLVKLIRSFSAELKYNTKTCLQFRKAFLDWSKMKKDGKLILAKGVENRRKSEVEFFLYKKCVF